MNFRNAAGLGHCTLKRAMRRWSLRSCSATRLGDKNAGKRLSNETRRQGSKRDSAHRLSDETAPRDTEKKTCEELCDEASVLKLERPSATKS